MAPSGTDVLIVGAGPVGLTMAAAMARQGRVCRIVDKAPAPTDKSKALVVWCRTMELLDGLELAEPFVAAGLKLSGGSVHAEGERIIHLKLTSEVSRFGFPLMLPQSETERLLNEHLERHGVRVERPVELVSFAEREDAIECVLRHEDGRTEKSVVPWLVGCDGAHSTVRRGLGMSFAGAAEGNDWMLADVRIDGRLAGDEISVYWHDGGVLVFVPMRGGRYRVIADLGASQEGSRPEPTLHEVQSKVDERGPGGLRLFDPVWLSGFRIHERKVAEYRRRRVLLAGDAAHIHSPAGGQGMNTGMQDAFNLAWKLALVQRGLGRADMLLDSYSSERSPVAEQVLRNAGRFTRLATLRSSTAQWLRNHIAPIVSSFEFVQERIRDEWFELSINYRDSPLCRDHLAVGAGGPRAGDRLGDGRVASALGNEAGSLFQMLRDPRHVLLVLEGMSGSTTKHDLVQIAANLARELQDVAATHLILAASAESPAPPEARLAKWLDPGQHVHKSLHARAPVLLLIRPDGYIGFRGPASDSAALHRHLETYLVQTR